MCQTVLNSINLVPIPPLFPPFSYNNTPITLTSSLFSSTAHNEPILVCFLIASSFFQKGYYLNFHL